MNLKILKISLLMMVAVSCSTTNSIVPSKYETVSSTTIDNDEYSSIYQILKSNFDDFTEKSNRKINYEKHNEDYSFQIRLKKNHFKMKYSSDKGYNDKINSIKSKIENIVK